MACREKLLDLAGSGIPGYDLQTKELYMEHYGLNDKARVRD
jgi:hypothetical protein